MKKLNQSRIVFRRRRKHFELQKKAYSRSESGAALLAAGVAHEFNNILGAVDGHAEWALAENTPEAFREALEITRIACQRSSQITRALAGLAQPKEDAWQRVNLQSVLNDCVKVLGLTPQNIEVEVDSPKKIFVESKGEKLFEIFLNLIKNAFEAGAKTIFVYIQLPPGNRKISKRKNSLVKIHFVDDGPGVTGVFVEALFKPFFTTKGVMSEVHGQTGGLTKIGTGLGLYLSKTFAMEQGGDLVFLPRILKNAPEKFKGAHFCLSLPLK